MTIAPMGCAVQFHIKPGRRTTFGEHSGYGFYLKTSEEHYRTHVIFAKKTRAKRLANTVFFKHKYITQPTITPADAIVNAYVGTQTHKLPIPVRGSTVPVLVPILKLTSVLFLIAIFPKYNRIH